MVSNQEEIGDYSIDGLRGVIYWTEPNSGSIQRVNIRNGVTSSLYSGVKKPQKMTLDLNSRLIN